MWLYVDDVLLNDQHAIPSMSGFLLAKCDSSAFRWSIVIDRIVRNSRVGLKLVWDSGTTETRSISCYEFLLQEKRFFRRLRYLPTVNFVDKRPRKS